MSRLRIGLAGVVLCAAWAAGCGESAEEREAARRREETRALMRELYAVIRVALPASADAETFGAPATRAKVAEALAHLAENAEELQQHTRRRDAEMRFLARSIARDSREVKRAYAEGRYDRAAFVMRQIVENCVVCHTRLPDREDSPVAEGFVEEVELDSLPLEARATLQIATRRFDDALVTLESLLASDEHPALMLGPITDYLVVSLRVKGDFRRSIPTLRRFAEREDVWTYLRRDVEDWIEALPELEARAAGPPKLATARALLEEGQKLSLLPDDGTPLAHFVTASAILQRFIEGRPEDRAELGEACYLLGLIEARIGRNYWVTPATFLLERSIRLAPGEPFAEEAYALLEREFLAAYEGSEYEELPDEYAARLSELRSLIEDARSPGE